MHRTTKLIQAYATEFPDCVYYVPLFSKARRNLAKHPDICIETCKSLLEGIAKTIIVALDANASLSELDTKSVEPLVKSAAKLLRANDDVIEDHFVNRVGSLAHALGALRNSRGDISHGKAVPKLDCSTDHLARLCLQMTDAICFYMLQSYFNAGGKAAAVSLYHTPDTLLPGGLLNVGYEENSDFNESLDQLYPLDGKLIYSDALYRLFYEDYLIELAAFRDAQSDDGEDGNGDAE